MNKKGWPLVEIIAVIAIIALLTILIYPQVTKLLSNMKTNTNEIQESSIKEASEQYLADHVGKDLNFTNNKEVVTLKVLIDEGYLEGSTKNSKTGRNFDLINSKVTITRTGEIENYKYTYKVELYDE